MMHEPQRQVGDIIRYSSGGTVHTGRIIEVADYGHVKVDTSPLMIPPAWILDDDEN
jgi:hypothetical protein